MYLMDILENLNNLLITEIEKERGDNPGGMIGTNPGCWRSMFKYKCEKELMKPIGMIMSAYMDHYFPKKTHGCKHNILDKCK